MENIQLKKLWLNLNHIIKKGDLGEVHALLGKHPSLIPYINANFSNSSILGPLHQALECGFNNIATYLLNYTCIDIKVKNTKFSFTPLHYAAITNDIKIAELLLERSSSFLNEQSKCEEETPLFMASEMGYLGMVKLLLEHGANPNISNISSRTPLHVNYGKKGDHLQITKLLINSGADMSMRCDENRSAASWYVANFKDADSLAYLISKMNLKDFKTFLDDEEHDPSPDFIEIMKSIYNTLSSDKQYYFDEKKLIFLLSEVEEYEQ